MLYEVLGWSVFAWYVAATILFVAHGAPSIARMTRRGKVFFLPLFPVIAIGWTLHFLLKGVWMLRKPFKAFVKSLVLVKEDDRDGGEA